MATKILHIRCKEETIELFNKFTQSTQMSNGELFEEILNHYESENDSLYELRELNNELIKENEEFKEYTKKQFEDLTRKVKLNYEYLSLLTKINDEFKKLSEDERKRFIKGRFSYENVMNEKIMKSKKKQK